MTAPNWLAHPPGLPPSALVLWKHFAPGLHRAGHLQQTNTEKLRILVRLLAIADAAAAQIEADGVVLREESGAVRQHPAIKVLLEAQKQAEPLLEAFGLWGE